MDEMPLAYCVIELVFDEDGHSVDFIFRYCNTHTGGQIKINDKVFDPADYPDKKEDK